MRGFFYIITYSFLILNLVLLTACNYNINKKNNLTNSGQNTESAPISEKTVISYSFVKTSIISTCLNCHVGHSAPEMGNINSIKQNITKILDAVHSNNMPPEKNGFAPLSDCKKAILDFWSSQSFPEVTSTIVGEIAACKGIGNDPNNPNDPNLIPIEKMPLNYQTLLSKVLQPRCIKCHNPDGEDLEAAGILFYPYNEILKRPKLWAGPGAKAKVVKYLIRNDEDRMPPPESGNPLSQEEVNFFVRWIDAGLPE